MNETDLARMLMEEYDEREWHVEVHYNHYGTRGVVDLVSVDECEWCSVYELKSESALEEVTGANEIIRQFKRHKNYFEKGVDSISLTDAVSYTLLFEATEKTIRHIRDNKSLYRSVEEDSLEEPATVSVYHEDIGIVPLTNDVVWEEDVRTMELKEVCL